MLNVLRDFLLQQGFDDGFSRWLTLNVEIVLVLVLAVLANMLAKRIVVRGATALIGKTTTSWDDVLIEHRVIQRMSHLAPALVVYHFALPVLENYPWWSNSVRQASLIYMLLVVVSVIDAALNAIADVMQSSEASQDLPIKSLAQVLKLGLYIIAGIAVLSLILGKSPLLLLSGLGAMTAVIMLVFKDAILGFVGGIQLSANRMVARGDWIEMPKYGADGDVIEVALTTVKVQNWDKTITTIPTYALISESFKNWRGMSESGGRRIKRAINLDVNSIRFCDDEMLKRFTKIPYMAEYLKSKRDEVSKRYKENAMDELPPGSDRRLTNVGTFRAYVIAYLRDHPMIHQDMTLMVRQLAPGPHGLPVEIYGFSRDQRWVSYENIQADVFDHILAMVPEFDLRVYQIP